MFSLDIPIIIDKKDRRLLKPFNKRPGYDMKYIMLYCLNYTGYGVQVRIDLQDLILQQKFSVFHQFCLFASYSRDKLEDLITIAQSHSRIYVEILEPKDLMLEHWNRDCFRPKTDFGLANDNTSDDKKFLGLTPHKVKISQTREQFNQWRTKWIELYKNNSMMCSSIINTQYQEYYILDNWIECKRSQLLIRFQKRLLKLEA
ncbi:hypothetical protein C2G38_2221251 [Gigaspora rosea]|uniref:Uncharacterized protein n=1 Tax=Gigaspora rosea TaxID=44941 RepID=A0A397UBX3_9GLOM|nr:hypothetical protein C2G38_2221251 [Gigaspora rosea]